MPFPPHVWKEAKSSNRIGFLAWALRILSTNIFVSSPLWEASVGGSKVKQVSVLARRLEFREV